MTEFLKERLELFKKMEASLFQSISAAENEYRQMQTEVIKVQAVINELTGLISASETNKE